MKTTANITGLVTIGSVNGIVQQLNDGSLVVGTYSPFTILKSTDNGANWVAKYNAISYGNARLVFTDSQGNVYFGNSGVGTQATVLKSSDNGETWTAVLTVDSSGVWYMAEDVAGNLYVSEYSAGDGTASELFAYNIWRSINSGATWAKWYTNPGQSSPAAKDGIRHVHGFFIDSGNRKYISFGDTPAYTGENVGKTYLMNDNGTLGAQVSDQGNGWVSFMEADNGRLLFGGDKAPMRIYDYDAAANTHSTALDLFARFDSPYNSPVYSLAKGYDGVIYMKNNEENGKWGGVFASADDGTTWYLLDISGKWLNGTTVTTNPNAPKPRVFISRSNSNYVSIPDLSRQHLRSLFEPGQGRRIVGWDAR